MDIESRLKELERISAEIEVQQLQNKISTLQAQINEKNNLIAGTGKNEKKTIPLSEFEKVPHKERSKLLFQDGYTVVDG